ncbi:MAG: hypothetical protein EYC70_08965 [Planctomycetota bacterium]|nr:MAG: hypothetical protein EYC70_08965 [Planctomycetota bacterium]
MRRRLLTLLCALLGLGAAPELTRAPAQAAAAGAREPQELAARAWWDKLPSEERAQWLERYQRFRSLSPPAQQEIRWRVDVLSEERRSAIAEMDAAERERWEALPPGERLRQLDVRVRDRLRGRALRFEAQFPGAGERLRQLPLQERLDAAGRMAQDARAFELQAGVRRAIDEGWIGLHSGKWLEQAPFHEQVEALMQVAKWRTLEVVRNKGLWDRYGLDEHERARVITLRPRDFFRAMFLLQRGMAKERVLALPELWERLRSWRLQDASLASSTNKPLPRQ